MNDAGLEVADYPYWDPKTKGLAFEPMIQTFKVFFFLLFFLRNKSSLKNKNLECTQWIDYSFARLRA